MYHNTRDYFSFFPHGWWNEVRKVAVMVQRPSDARDLKWVYDYIKSKRAREITEQLREMLIISNGADIRRFKMTSFDYVTFAGVFTYRNTRCIVTRSPYMVLDIDGLGSLTEAADLRNSLAADPSVETALCFVSPSGRGVKWVVELPDWTQGITYKRQFQAMRDYLGFTYGVDADRSGSDLCRACYLPHDAMCFINNKYLTNE